MTAAAVAVAALAAFASLPADEAKETASTTSEATEPPFYMTEDYEDMRAEEREADRREAEALLESIERYNQRKQEEAEAAFREMADDPLEGYEEVPYPFDTMSQDWGAGDLDGFVPYHIPDEYEREGGYFPEIAQKYLYITCRNAGVEYPKAVALIECESGYQYDCIGEADDTGYMQVVPRFHQDRMERLNCTDMENPYQNMAVGVDYLSELLGKYGGNYRMALTAYQYGEDGAYKYWFSAGVEANPYARAVLAKAERIEEELANAAED